MNVRAFLVIAAAVGALVSLIAGCSTGSHVELRSADGLSWMAPTLSRGAFATGGGASADIYLTDLPRGALEPGVEFAQLTGQIVHIALFVSPRAGRTPVNDAACTAALRHVIFDRGVVGVYAGGGFVRSSAPGEGLWGDTIRGDFVDATLRPSIATPDFVDRLGPGTMRGHFDAPEDARLARLLAARLDEAVARASAARLGSVK
jgi:hypothetical protein